MMDFTFVEITLIIFSQILLLFLFNMFTKKDSRKYDIFKDSIWINLTQTFSLLFILFCSYRLYLIFTAGENQNQNILKI